MRWNIWVASARLIKTRSICILIVGEGEKLIELKAYAQTEGLKNIVFLPKIVKAQVPSVMRKLDVCFIGWRVTKLYDYGISPNKIPEYLMSGKPVLHSFSGPNDPHQFSGCRGYCARRGPSRYCRCYRIPRGRALWKNVKIWVCEEANMLSGIIIMKK